MALLVIYITIALFRMLQSCPVEKCHCIHQMLDCSYTSFEKVPKISCEQLSGISIVSLKGNYIVCPEESFVQLLQCVHSIDITDNPLNCTCVDVSDTRIRSNCREILSTTKWPKSTVKFSTIKYSTSTPTLISNRSTLHSSFLPTVTRVPRSQVRKTAQWILETSIAVPVLIFCLLLIVILRKRIRNCNRRNNQIQNDIELSRAHITDLPGDDSSEEEITIFSISESFV